MGVQLITLDNGMDSFPTQHPGTLHNIFPNLFRVAMLSVALPDADG